MSNDQGKPGAPDVVVDDESATSKLRKASEDLKAKIEDAKRRNDMPIDSALGNPHWEKNAADGHLDVPDKDDDE
jgi:hypothetical protein